ncbi:MAG: YidC/Oxa1 family insertase periplasmic-domain containing protein [Phycisphaerae bacterium]
MRFIFTLIVIGFVVFCGWLVVESGLDCCESRIDKGTAGQPCILLQSSTGGKKNSDANVPAEEPPQIGADESVTFGADSAPAKSVTLGSVDPNSGFNFQLELSSKGAAIRKATFSGFDDRDYKNPQPLVIISPVQERDGREILTIANTSFIFVQQQLQLPLDRLHWKSLDKEITEDGSQTARFEAIIKIVGTNEPVLKLIKTYKITPRSYLLECNIAVENLSDTEQKVRFNLSGPGGLGREDFRSDMRNIIAGFRDTEGQVSSVRLDIKNLNRAKSIEDRRLVKPGANFLWVAATNKYFAAILVPLPEEGKDHCDWVTDKTGRFHNPDGDSKADSGDEAIGLDLTIASNTLAAAGQTNNTKTYNFQLYVGPKDKSLFDKNERYRELGFVQTITFIPCFCCPAGLIYPLAFGILALMKWMYAFIPNYGVVIIILVFLMRIAMHPITKKSQVSMSKMSKLAPKAEEIKKKYANNKAEMNKQIMALYREQGASPVMGFLPMMVQMPIWIALWSAVYASIDLRGAPFLPFWITDLSMPDALVSFSKVTVPLLNWKIQSLNLLPILMGVAMYLQQKLMPSQAPAGTASPQAAQQQQMQKTMMIMMPLFLPLVLYNGPSGVNLYIMSSTFAGVVEQYIIRKHIREKEEAESKGLVAATSKTGGKVKKKKPKPFYKI